MQEEHLHSMLALSEGVTAPVTGGRPTFNTELIPLKTAEQVGFVHLVASRFVFEGDSSKYPWDKGSVWKIEEKEGEKYLVRDESEFEQQVRSILQGRSVKALSIVRTAITEEEFDNPRDDAHALEMLVEMLEQEFGNDVEVVTSEDVMKEAIPGSEHFGGKRQAQEIHVGDQVEIDAGETPWHGETGTVVAMDPMGDFVDYTVQLPSGNEHFQGGEVQKVAAHLDEHQHPLDGDGGAKPGNSAVPTFDSDPLPQFRNDSEDKPAPKKGELEQADQIVAIEVVTPDHPSYERLRNTKWPKVLGKKVTADRFQAMEAWDRATPQRRYELLMSKTILPNDLGPEETREWSKMDSYAVRETIYADVLDIVGGELMKQGSKRTAQGFEIGDRVKLISDDPEMAGFLGQTGTIRDKAKSLSGMEYDILSDGGENITAWDEDLEKVASKRTAIIQQQFPTADPNFWFHVSKDTINENEYEVSKETPSSREPASMDRIPGDQLERYLRDMGADTTGIEDFMAQEYEDPYWERPGAAIGQKRQAQKYTVVETDVRSTGDYAPGKKYNIIDENLAVVDAGLMIYDVKSKLRELGVDPDGPEVYWAKGQELVGEKRTAQDDDDNGEFKVGDDVKVDVSGMMGTIVEIRPDGYYVVEDAMGFKSDLEAGDMTKRGQKQVDTSPESVEKILSQKA